MCRSPKTTTGLDERTCPVKDFIEKSYEMITREKVWIPRCRCLARRRRRRYIANEAACVGIRHLAKTSSAGA
jgi:hypothetical protein